MPVQQGNFVQTACREDENYGICLFPALNDAVNSDENYSVRRVDVNEIPGFESLGESSDDEFCTFFAGVWSIILYYYTNTEEVSFMIHKDGLDTLESIHNEAQRGALSLLRVSVRPSHPVRYLLDASSYHVISPYPKRHEGVNTGLSFCTSSGYIYEAFCKTSCRVGLVVDVRSRRPFLWSQPCHLSDAQSSNIAAAVGQAIQCLLSSSDQKVKAISLIGSHHINQIARWNSRTIYPAPSSSIYDLIEPYCRSCPDATAICSWDGELSYERLHSLSSKLSGHLRALDIGPNSVVGLCFEKSLWAIVSLVAVIRAGGAFVFLHHSHPTERKKYILSQTRSKIILVSPRQRHLFVDLSVQQMEVSESAMSQLPESAAPSRIHSLHDTAVLVYTSGSSGNPKGCVINHGSLASSIPKGQNWPVNETCNRMLQFSPYIFGTCLLEIFSALTTGGVVCIPSEDGLMNDLVGKINRLGVTGAILPPSLAKYIDPQAVPTIRMLAMGGEPLDKVLFHRWADKLRMVQGYGMSENSGILTINDSVTGDSDPRNVGRSPNGRLWLVDPDDHNRLAPIGAVAEIVVEGPGIAREYLNEPEKSAATFLEYPTWLQHFSLKGRGRFLKTGDLARYTSDGTIIHLGRKDSQVKIRGHRVDVKEVEHQLRPLMGGTVDVYVELVRLKKGSPILAAFLWSKDWPKPPEEALSNHGIAAASNSLRLQIETADSSLRNRLPDFMIPAVYIPLAHLPTTATDKIDRRSLRERASLVTRAELEALVYGEKLINTERPLTETEMRLQRLVASVLDVDKGTVRVDDNFFRLGGDSVAAIRLSTQARMAGIAIHVADIFRLGTILQMALHAEAAGDIPAGLNKEEADAVFEISPTYQQVFPSLPAIQLSENEVEAVFPCTPMQELKLWVQSQWTKNNSQRFAVEIASLSSAIDIEKLQRAWQALVKRHSILRTVFAGDPKKEGSHIQIVLKSAIAPVHVTTNGDHIDASLCTEHLPHQFKPGQLPYRLTLRQQTSKTIVLEGQMTHAIIDAASTSILLHELNLAYANQLPDSVAPRFAHYASYIHETLDRSEKYWLDYLKDTPECFLYPCFSLEKNLGIYQRAKINIAEDFAEISFFCQRNNVTIPTLVKSVWSVVLWLWTLSPSICFAYHVSGRDVPIPGVQNMVGPLLGLLACRLHLSPEQNLGEIMKAIQDDYHRSLPYHAGTISALNKFGKPASRGIFNTIINHHKHETVDKISMKCSELAFNELCVKEAGEFQIVVFVDETPQDLQISLDYWDSLLSERVAEELTVSFANVMSSFINAKETTISTVEKMLGRECTTVRESPVL